MNFISSYFSNMIKSIIILIVITSIFLILFLTICGHYLKRMQELEETECRKLKELDTLNNKIKEKEISHASLNKDISLAQEQLNSLKKGYQQEKENLETFKRNCRLGKESYFTLLDSQYKTEEEKTRRALINLEETFSKTNNKLQEKEKELEERMSQIQAAAIASAQEKKKEENAKFYQIQIFDSDIEDIKWLKQLEARSPKAKEAIKKLIWSIYYQKPTTEMCNRVVGAGTVCGIYKITSLTTHECYIGQSVNISQRFKSHAKCGLGIDAPSMNKLYKIIQEEGLHNFTFEVIEKCEEKNLNERERVWINTYASDKYGLNSKGGNK